MGRDKEHNERKKYLKNFPDREILREALERAALDEKEKEAVRLFLCGVPIGVIADRLVYNGKYFSEEKFKRVLVKYVYCVQLIQAERKKSDA